MHIHVFAYTYTHTYATPKSYHIYIIGYWYCLIAIYGKVKTSVTVLNSCLQLHKYIIIIYFLVHLFKPSGCEPLAWLNL